MDLPMLWGSPIKQARLDVDSGNVYVDVSAAVVNLAWNRNRTGSRCNLRDRGCIDIYFIILDKEESVYLSYEMSDTDAYAPLNTVRQCDKNRISGITFIFFELWIPVN